jgi:DNA-binding transcriptional MerR regulator
LKSDVLSNQLSVELGIRIDPTRLTKYESKGVIRTPRKLGKYKDYTPNDYDRIKKTVLLSELGIHLDDIRRYLMGLQTPELEEVFKDKIRKMEKLVVVGKQVFNVA